MELGCVVMLFGVPLMIWWFIEYIRDQSKKGGQTPRMPISSSQGKYHPGVRTTGPDDLTSWALHKHPQDIEAHDYGDLSVLDADVVIHREGGVNKIVKGPDSGRILTDWEVDELEEDDEDGDTWEEDQEEEDREEDDWENGDRDDDDWDKDEF
jgi:hypothetical protein